jgi:hypothetical protein
MTDPIHIALDRLHDYAVGHPNHDTDEIVEAARTALAQSEPEGPTNEEIDALERKCWKLESLVEYDPCTGFSEVFPKDETFDHRAFAHAVLKRWGHPTIEPVPVAERPWEREGWCDAEQACWAIGHRDRWERVYVPGRDWSNPTYTHLLPHHALPIPTTH